jgi:DnaJ domain
MTAPFWAGLLLLAFGAVAILRIRLTRQQQVAALVLAAAVGLVVLRQFALAIPVAILGLGLWRRGGPIPEPDDTSEVETPALRMTLDHGTGRMDGEVLTGRFAGARLSGLSAEDLEALVAEIEAAGDEDSLAVLLAWLDRQGTPREAPPPGGQPMTEAEAYRILGLEPGASLEEVRAAHRQLIRRVHPDLGGSSALAAMINAAKEMLDPG